MWAKEQNVLGLVLNGKPPPRKKEKGKGGTPLLLHTNLTAALALAVEFTGFTREPANGARRTIERPSNDRFAEDPKPELISQATYAVRRIPPRARLGEEGVS